MNNMGKKDYIKPIVKAVKLYSEHHLMEESHPGVNSFQTAREMRNDVWDDEEEEIEDSMWK